jgi:phosphopantothenoylcysteine decarboxylase / phosphopantothenate---cysteine ligase
VPDVAGALANRTIVVGVCGSIAAYKVAVLVRRLRQEGADVHVVMTPAATRFVGPVTFRALSQRPVITDMWDPNAPWDEPHVALGERADLYVIAPATADMVGKLAGGLADDLVCATALATRAPVLVAPAMSDHMAESPVVQDNLARLRARGVHVIGPERGPLASGRIGLGRMSEPEAIVAEVIALVGGRPALR